MRIGVVGSPHVSLNPTEWDTGKSIWNGIPDHSICSATVGITRNLRRHGFDAFICHPTRAQELRSADALFICEFNFLDRVLEVGAYPSDRPIVVWLHSPYPGKLLTREGLSDRCAGICFTREEALLQFEARGGSGGCPKWVAPWAFPEWWPEVPERPNPYDPNKVSVLFAGRSAPKGRVPSLIEEVSSLSVTGREFEIHIFSDVGKYIEKDPEAAKVVSRYYKMPNVMFHGSWNHGTFLNYMYHADLALDTGAIPDKIANNCKIWDYLAMGVPVVSDRIAGGTELISQTGCGTVAEEGRFVGAVVDSLDWKFPREETRVFMRQHHTWATTVDGWIHHFRKAIS